jgi:hypothetical protein
MELFDGLLMMSRTCLEIRWYGNDLLQFQPGLQIQKLLTAESHAFNKVEHRSSHLATVGAQLQ